MDMMTRAKQLLKTATALGLLVFLTLGPAELGAQDQGKKPGLFGPWVATAELSYVVTGGNTATSALSFGTSFSRKWTDDQLLFKSYILKSNATSTTRIAQGTENAYTIHEEKITRKVAENYLLAGQYDRRISKKLLGQAGVGWDRNRFAGIDDRLIATLGFGYAWIERPRTQVKTSAGLTYTVRQYVGLDWESFGGLRFSVNADQKIYQNASLSSVFVFDENLKDTPDWRFDWANSLTASLSKSLALKISLRTLYTHQPALQGLPLYDYLGDPTSLFVYVPLKKLDTFLMTSIVVNF
jgi:putative salt-induced outer membrane protein YdiY